MTVEHTANLGWTTGQTAATTSSLLTAWLAAMSSGDELVLDEMYNITGGAHTLKTGCILSAVQGGGFNDAGYDNNSVKLLQLQTGSTLRNVTFTATGAPPRSAFPNSGDPIAGTHFGRRNTIGISGSNVSVEYCAFNGNIEIHIEAVDAKFMTIYRCIFKDTKYQVYCFGAVDDMRIEDCVFQTAIQDGLKTGEQGTGAAKRGVKRPQVRTCIFQDLYRDGVDTTGGFKNGHIYRCQFRRNGKIGGGICGGIDFKTAYELGQTTADLNTNNLNQDILVEECEFSDCPDAVSPTTQDKTVAPKIINDNPSSPYYAPLWATCRIVMRNCIIEKNPGGGASFVREGLLKSSHTLAYENLRLFGTGILPYVVERINETFPANNSPAIEAVLSYGYTRTYGTPGAARGVVTSYPSYVGPQGTIITPGNPDINAKAISIDSATGVLAANTNNTAPATFNVNIRCTGPGGVDVEPQVITVGAA